MKGEACRVALDWRAEASGPGVEPALEPRRSRCTLFFMQTAAVFTIREKP